MVILSPTEQVHLLFESLCDQTSLVLKVALRFYDNQSLSLAQIEQDFYATCRSSIHTMNRKAQIKISREARVSQQVWSEIRKRGMRDVPQLRVLILVGVIMRFLLMLLPLVLFVRVEFFVMIEKCLQYCDDL